MAAAEAGLIFLEDDVRQGPVRVWLRTNVENGWRPVQITVGEIAGASQDFVVVGGHQVSWPGLQATDNAAGTACILELARVFNRCRGQLRRRLVFGCWTGHETGTMIGSAWFADQNWARLRAHAVAYLQIDHPACVGAPASVGSPGLDEPDWATPRSQPPLADVAFHDPAALDGRGPGHRVLDHHPDRTRRMPGRRARTLGSRRGSK